MKNPLALPSILGPSGSQIAASMRAGLDFLKTRRPQELLQQVGRTVRSIPAFRPIDKSALQDSFGGSQAGASEDLLVGRGLFYFTEQRKLFLDCTSGHYQMLWGYSHPGSCAAIAAASAPESSGTTIRIFRSRHSNGWGIGWSVWATPPGKRTRSTRCSWASAPDRWPVRRHSRSNCACSSRRGAGTQYRSWSRWKATITAATCCRSSCAGCGPAWCRASK